MPFLQFNEQNQGTESKNTSCTAHQKNNIYGIGFFSDSKNNTK